MLMSTPKRLAMLAALLVINGCFPMQGQPRTLRLAPATPATPPAAQAILIHASGGPDCRDSVAISVPASNVLEGLRDHIDPACGCRPGSRIAMGVVAQGHAGVFVDSTRLCRFDQGELTVELRPRRNVRVDVWTPNATMLALARDDFANLDWILDFNRTGITIDPVFQKPSALVNGKDFCREEPPREIHTPGVVNLYFGAGTLNQSCGATNSVLVHDLPVLGDAAHEMGHRLGLDNKDRSGEQFENGRTTDHKGFTCANAMWSSSEVLKKFFSPGQAFWMNFGCTSFLNSNGPCLRCEPKESEDVADPPACPIFRLRALGEEQSDEAGECQACSLQQAEQLVRESGRSDLRVVPSNAARLCDVGTLRQRLRDRFLDLERHVTGKPHLALGSRTADQFVERWSRRIGVIITIETTAKAPKDSKEREKGLELLEQVSVQRRFAGNRYLPYAIQKIKHNVYQPRCESGLAK
jgi:hypothetical protein